MRKNLVKLVFSILGIMIFSLILFSFADGGKGKPWDIPAKYKKMKILLLQMQKT